MKIVIAVDSFKGSLSSTEAADAIARGAARAIPGVSVAFAPLGDGGEGTVAALVAAIPGSKVVKTTVSGPLGEPVEAAFGILGPDGHVAAVEMAAASGITLIPASARNPLLTSTYGTGQVIDKALGLIDVTDLVIGLGGSATNDGGAGALQALGVDFIDDEGGLLPEPITGGDVGRIVGFSDPGLNYGRLKSVTLACDVTNPLCGPRGASAVFGPQKGATPEMVERLDADLAKFSQVLDTLFVARGGTLQDSIARVPGSGAAGGIAAGLLSFFPNATLRPGIDLVLDTIDFDNTLADADLVITGEGKLDSQTLFGKAIDGVLRRAKAANVPAVAFAGYVDPAAAAELGPRGLVAAFGLMEIAESVEDAMANAAALLEELVASRLVDVVRLLETIA